MLRKQKISLAFFIDRKVVCCYGYTHKYITIKLKVSMKGFEMILNVGIKNEKG